VGNAELSAPRWVKGAPDDGHNGYLIPKAERKFVARPTCECWCSPLPRLDDELGVVCVRCGKPASP
jgi:hypothetical protein